MKKALFIVACSFFISVHLSAQVLWQFSVDTVVKWYYQGGDEFNGSKINTDQWAYYLWARSLYMNSEQQYYTEGKNHELSNGTLKLKAKREPGFRKTVDYMRDSDSLFAGKKFISLNKVNYNFTSGKLASKEVYNKGYFECRFRIPANAGYWPAFWLHGGDPNEEIDIMESESRRPTQIHVDTHCPNHCDMVWRNLSHESFGAWIQTKKEFVNEFNVVACEWNDKEVKFYLNGEFIAISNVQFNVPKHLTINLAVPSDKGPFGPGPMPSDSTGVFEVDYVRVWTKEAEKQMKNPPAMQEAKKIANQDSVPAKSILKKTGKSYYGSKRKAEKEGIKVSAFLNERLLQLNVMGNCRGEFPTIEIVRKNGNFSFKQTIYLQNNEISLHSFEKGQYDLIVSWKEQKGFHSFELN